MHSQNTFSIPTLAFLLLFGAVVLDAKFYQLGDKVEVLVNKIGPYANLHETYHYYQLPLCRPIMIKHKSLSLGQLLNGDRMAESPYLLHYGRQQLKTSVCGRYKVTGDDLKTLTEAVEKNFYFELVIDNIRVRSFFGFLEEQNSIPHRHRAFLYTHLIFLVDFSTEMGEIYRIDLQPDQNSAVDLNAKPDSLELFYSVKWNETNRLVRQSNSGEGFFGDRTTRIQWMAVLNSALLVVLLIGLVAWILRSVVKRDLSRYNEVSDEDLALENGWKPISMDVFRPPSCRILFAAIIGVGSQFLILITVFLIAAAARMIDTHAGANTVAVTFYTVTSVIGGFVSAYVYRQFEGKNWVANANLTACLFAVPFILSWMVNNTVSWGYGSTQALPYTTVIVLALIWLCIAYPLTVVGAVIGKNQAVTYVAPCRTRNVPRQLPQLPFYKTDFMLMLFGGFFSFSAMSVELYYLFITVWGHEMHAIFYLMLVVHLIVIAVTAMSSIALIYVKLSAEDYRWWWASIFIGGSVSIFVFAYALFFYLYRSEMYGLLETVGYFSDILLISYGFFLMMGTVSFLACHRFVRFIYSNVKCD